MSWYSVSVAWEGDNAYTYAVEADTEDDARRIALEHAPQPDATVALIQNPDEIGLPDESEIDFDAVIPA